MSYVVHFCRNCDGGTQERDSAIAAIKEVFPDAVVDAKCSDEYPIRLDVVSPNGSVLWSGSQKHLFRKRGQERIDTMKIISNAVRDE